MSDQIDIFISSYKNIELVDRLKNNLQKYILDKNVTYSVVCGAGESELYNKKFYNNIIETDFINKTYLTNMAYCALGQLYKPNSISIYLPYYTRLINYVNISNRYNSLFKYLTYNIKDIQIINTNITKNIKLLSEEFTSDLNYLISDSKLLSLSKYNNCRLIDKLWLSMDCYSTKLTTPQHQLIDYIDNFN